MKQEKDKDNDSKKRTGGKIETDPLGSWTGTPADEKEIPVQDADDL